MEERGARLSSKWQRYFSDWSRGKSVGCSACVGAVHILENVLLNWADSWWLNMSEGSVGLISLKIRSCEFYRFFMFLPKNSRLLRAPATVLIPVKKKPVVNNSWVSTLFQYYALFIWKRLTNLVLQQKPHQRKKAAPHPPPQWAPCSQTVRSSISTLNIQMGAFYHIYTD